MSNLIPGNQKHLTLDSRVFIEKCLDQDMPMKDIAKPLCKEQSFLLMQRLMGPLIPKSL